MTELRFRVLNPPQDRPFVATAIYSPVGPSIALSPPSEGVAGAWQLHEQLDQDVPAQTTVRAAWIRNNAPGTQPNYVGEISAAVPAGTQFVTVDDSTYEDPDEEVRVDALQNFNPRLIRLVAVANRIRMVFANANTSVTEAVSLSGASVRKTSRFGRFRRTLAFHKNTVSFGGVHWWFDYAAFDPRLFLTINWHNGIPRSHVLFTQVQLLLPAGYHWKPVLDTDRTYLSNALVRNTHPVTGVPVNHMLGQRTERPFRVVIWHEDDPEPTYLIPDIALHDSESAPIATGMVMGPHRVIMPRTDHIPTLAAQLRTQYTTDATRLFNLTQDPDYGNHAPQSFFVPQFGVKYGGMSSGIHIDFLNGLRPFTCYEPDGIKSLYIGQLRLRARPSGCIYANVISGQLANLGEPCRPELAMNAGFAPFAMDTFRRFLNQGGVIRDMPWNFKAYPPPAGPASYQNTLENTYITGGWDPIDDQHYIRAMRDNIALANIGDDLAVHYLTMDAETGRMACWNKPGQWRSMFDVVTPSLGVGYGRGAGWTQYLVAAAGYFCDELARYNDLKAYASYFATNRSKAIMPSGLILAATSGKASCDPPFGNGSVADYWVAQNFEEIIATNGQWSAYQVFGEFPLFGAITTPQLIVGMHAGFKDLAWHTDSDGQSITGLGHTGPWKRYPLGPVAPPGTRYTDRGDFLPLNICVEDPEDDVPYDNTLDGFYIAQFLYIAWEAETPSVDILATLNLHLAQVGDDFDELRAAVQALGTGPGGGSKIETFGGLLNLALE